MLPWRRLQHDPVDEGASSKVINITEPCLFWEQREKAEEGRNQKRQLEKHARNNESGNKVNGRQLAKHQRTHPHPKVRGQLLLPKLLLTFYLLNALPLIIDQREKIKLEGITFISDRFSCI